MGFNFVHLFIVGALFAALSTSTPVTFVDRPCPVPCDNNPPELWTTYHDLIDLDACAGTLLFQTHMYNGLGDSEAGTFFRSCTATQASQPKGDNAGRIAKKQKRQFLSFNTTAPRSAKLQLVSGQESQDVSTEDVQSALTSLSAYIDSQDTDEDSPGMPMLTTYAKKGNAFAGTYVGLQVQRHAAATAVTTFAKQFSSTTIAAQACGSPDYNKTTALQVFGIVVDSDVSVVQKTLRGWHEAKCLSSGQPLEGATIDFLSGALIPVSPQKSEALQERDSRLMPRATCKYTQVKSGDGCWALADRCGITQAQLQNFNGGSKFCTTPNPKVGAYACCSSGDPPDFSPKPGADGTCYTHLVKEGDTCADLAAAHQTTQQAIEDSNKKTWGWAGCVGMQWGNNICLGRGNPPFPANLPDAICGPQKNGTVKTTDYTKWPGLNKCPLNACCNVWGQCGITADFCTDTRAPTGNDGTRGGPGENGCISNCGTKIVTGTPPAKFERVGYFEAFNIDRSCNTMRVGSIPPEYTIIHWAFADLSRSYDVIISPYERDWAAFTRATGYKKVVSFGGWAFSTQATTYDIFRKGVSSSQRETFANKIVQFVSANNLDGVDFDWEYPSAPDDQGEGLPLAGPEDAKNYLEFLRLVRKKLPSGKTVSIAAPASFWYLKAFPIDDIGDVVDYIIYMTYDLHGQWDYGNKHSSPDCPKGDCLRSHLNRTETESALVMITKAGVPAKKVFVGQAMYGRSFKMTKPGCWKAGCTFVGPVSGAKPGRCTGTSGYISNLEIREIISSGQHKIQKEHDPIAGDILIYDDTEWVSWSDVAYYNERANWVRGLGFGGLSDWAIDLNMTSPGGGIGASNNIFFVNSAAYASRNPVVSCKPPCLVVMPPWKLPYTTTISRPPVTATWTDEWSYVVTAPGGVTSTEFVQKVTTTTITIPPVKTTEIPVSNYEWTDTKDVGFDLTSSIRFPGIILTQGSTVVKTSGKTSTLTGLVYTYSPPAWPPHTKGQSSSPGATTTRIPPPPPPPTGCSTCPGRITVASTSGPSQPTCTPPCGKGELDDDHRDDNNNNNDDDDDDNNNDDDDDDDDGGGGGGSNIVPPCLGVDCTPCVPPLPCCIGSCGGGRNGGGDNSNEPTKTCSTKTAVTDCSVACSVKPNGPTLSTSCYTTTCSATSVCESVGSTTTSRTTVACPSVPEYTPWFGGKNPAELHVTIGDGGFGGHVIETGTWTRDGTSRSSTSTSRRPSATPTSRPKTPLERGPIKCFNEDDFPGHADIQSGDQDEFSNDFSALRLQLGDDDLLRPNSPTVRMRRTDKHGVNYDFSCGWVPGCETEVDAQSFGFPLGWGTTLITSYLMVREDYTKCNNGGVGGSCQVGCLLYTFEGGRGAPPSRSSCGGFDCGGCGTPFDDSKCQTCCEARLLITSEPAGNGSTNTGLSIVDNGHSSGQ